jgi:hypothetical protein
MVLDLKLPKAHLAYKEAGSRIGISSFLPFR